MLLIEQSTKGYNMEPKNKEIYAKIHSAESFGTVDGPRNQICAFYAGVSYAM